MILFIGTESNGFFTEEIAKQFNMEVKYSGACPSLEVMKYEALAERYAYIIIDVASLPFETEDLRDTIAQIALATQGKLIVYAQGYLPDARLVQECAAAGIEYFLLSNSVSTLRAELERALKGQPTPLPLSVTKNGKTEDSADWEHHRRGRQPASNRRHDAMYPDLQVSPTKRPLCRVH